jgi:phosphatidylglycerophosphatase A
VKIINYLIATAFGAGYAPLAPGTAGSILCLLIVYFFSPVPFLAYLLVLVLLFFLGVYSSSRVEKDLGHDPSIVVVDEVVGMGISLLFLPPNFWLFFMAFLLFRVFDILKPPPINLSQKLPGGWGVMMDDLIAGLYALAVVHIIRYFAGM